MKKLIFGIFIILMLLPMAVLADQGEPGYPPGGSIEPYGYGHDFDIDKLIDELSRHINYNDDFDLDDFLPEEGLDINYYIRIYFSRVYEYDSWIADISYEMIIPESEEDENGNEYGNGNGNGNGYVFDMNRLINELLGVLNLDAFLPEQGTTTERIYLQVYFNRLDEADSWSAQVSIFRPYVPLPPRPTPPPDPPSTASTIFTWIMIISSFLAFILSSIIFMVNRGK